MREIQTTNPATGETLGRYPLHSEEQAAQIAEQAHAAFLAWRKTAFTERSARLRRLGALLRERKDGLGRLITAEMGKVLKEAVAEVEKCAGACEYFADHGPAMLADQPVATGFSHSYVTFQPLGVVLAIMPWNFPFWQVIRTAAPTLMAGNALVLKHASNTPGCALALERLVAEAGFPAGLFAAVLLAGSEAEWLINHSRVRAVTLTGSTPAGREVAARAGAQLKKTVLELGGSDAYVILPDADLAHAARACAAGRLLNAGQSCISAKRLVVVESVQEEFTRLLEAEFRAVRRGDPLDPATAMGPLARRGLREKLHAQVQQSVALGARCLLGGEVPEGPGAFYPPTILTQITPRMPAYGEELFGPVACVITAADEEDAVRIANGTPFGLGGGVFTRDLSRGERLARESLESGSCFVNAFVRSDARLPFGGVKDSGYGRELSSFGIHEFVNIKSVAIA